MTASPNDVFAGLPGKQRTVPPGLKAEAWAVDAGLVSVEQAAVTLGMTIEELARAAKKSPLGLTWVDRGRRGGVVPMLSAGGVAHRAEQLAGSAARKTAKAAAAAQEAARKAVRQPASPPTKRAAGPGVRKTAEPPDPASLPLDTLVDCRKCGRTGRTAGGGLLRPHRTVKTTPGEPVAPWCAGGLQPPKPRKTASPRSPAPVRRPFDDAALDVVPVPAGVEPLPWAVDNGWCRIHETAARLETTTDEVLDLIHDGELRAARITHAAGERVMVWADDVDDLIDELAAEEDEGPATAGPPSPLPAGTLFHAPPELGRG